MAIVSIPHSWNHRRWRSSVKVPNVRTGSEARSGPTAATCIFAPTSMARGWTGDIARDWTGLFRPVMSASPCVAKQREGAQVINFLTGITARRHHSQVRNNPWTTFFYGIIRHQKFAGRSPPPSDSTAGPFLWPQAGRRGFFSNVFSGLLSLDNRSPAAGLYPNEVAVTMNDLTRQPATLQEVADAAGVHRSTASRALNPEKAHLIGQDVVERVQAAARRIGYQRDVLAAGLRTKRSRLIGVV